MLRFDFARLKAGHPAAFALETRIRFQDIDAARIMFFARAFDLFHDAFVAFLRQQGLPLADMLEAGKEGGPLKHVEADYLRPLRCEDPVRVEIVASAVEGSDFAVGYRVVRSDGSPRAGEVCIVGTLAHTWVAFGPSGLTRQEVPPTLAAALAPFE